MKIHDIRRVFTILIIVILTYGVYYYQDEITGFFSSVGSNNKVESTTSQETEEKVKVVVVDEEDAVIKVVEEVAPAVVSIVRKEVLFDPFNGPVRAEDSIGTGFIIDGKKGIVLTNKHVVNSKDASFSVVMGEGTISYDAKKIYRDPINDFAIVDLGLNGDESLPELTLGDSDKLKVGQTVIAIGNTLGEFGNSVTKGVISGLKRGIIASDGPFGRAEALEDVIQTDAALNPGNSGGPLLNLSGKVIGINVAISRGAENLGFAIPINTLESVIDDFKESGKISRPFLGVEYTQITKEIAESRAFPVGAFVRKVMPNSPADKAEIKAGDIILKLNGVRINDDNTLAKVVARQETGKELDIVVDRNGKELTLKASLQDLEE